MSGENGDLPKVDGNQVNRIEVFADADALPRDALQSIQRIAQIYQAHVVTVSSINHHVQSPHHITVDASPQATDMKILSTIRREVKTLVVTQDYGLAALALAKGARALSPIGLEFTEINMDSLLAERAMHALERRAGKHHRGPKARTEVEKRRFAEGVQRILMELAAGASGGDTLGQ